MKTKTNTSFFVMRHGEARHNVNKLTSGIETPLTDAGQVQVIDAAEILKWVGITDIVSSDMLRAKQTAEIIKRVLREDGQDVSLHFSSKLRERKMGDFAGRGNSDGVSVDALPTAFHQHPDMFNAESRMDVFHRASNVGKQLLQQSEQGVLGENVLIIGHGMFNDMLQYFLCKGGNVEFNEKEYLEIAGRQQNAGIVKIDVANAKLRQCELIFGDPNFRSRAVLKMIAEKSVPD